jgi:LysR family nitrogen assimilation transcriptional regulator
MELERLRMFLAVAECGSFTEAAKRLFVSHSTMSRAVAALERELGVPLLRRNSRSVVLTPAGEVLLDRAEALLREADALAEAVRSAAEAV